MDNQVLEGRQKNLKAKDIDIMRSRENFKLTLRKSKLEEQILNKRLRKAECTKLEEEHLRIKLSQLEINPNLNYHYEIEDDKEPLLIKLLQDSDKDVVRFALMKSTHFTSDLRTEFNKDDEEEVVLDQNLFDLILFYLTEDDDEKIKVIIQFKT